MSRSPSTPSLSRRIRSVELSATIAMAQTAGALRRAGQEILDFSVGEPDQPTPTHVIRAAERAMRAGHTKYTPTAGVPELREAVALRYRKDFGVRFEPSQVAICNGGKQALYNAYQCLLNPGDEVIIPTPCWPTFTEAARLAGARPVLLETRERHGFRLTARAVEKAVGPRTRALLLNTPSNPTGAVLGDAQLLEIARVVRRRGITLLFDDTYGLLRLDGRRTRIGRLHKLLGDQLVVLGTASKSYCMTGWRIGWLLGSRSLVAATSALTSHSTQHPSSFAQLGAVAALTGSQKNVESREREYRARAELVYPRLMAIDGISCVKPAGGFYLFPNVGRLLTKSCPTTLELAMRLLEEERLAVVPGEGFAAPGHLRISFARGRRELREGMRRLGRFLGALGPSSV